MRAALGLAEACNADEHGGDSREERGDEYICEWMAKHVRQPMPLDG